MKTKKHGLQIRVDELKATGLCFESDFASYGCRAKFEDITFNFPLADGAREILKMAYRQFLFSPYTLEKIERLTMAIMAVEGLDSGSTCQAQHIAEAIQYISETNGTAL